MGQRTHQEAAGTENIRARLRRDGSIILHADGTETYPDSMSASGPSRMLIRSFEALKRRSIWKETCGKTEADAAFLMQAAVTGLLDGEDGNRITIAEGVHQLSVRGKSEDGIVSFSLGIKGSDDAVRQMLCGMALAGNQLHMIASADDEEGKLTEFLSQRIAIGNLPQFLSLLLSRYDFLDINLEGYTTVTRKPIAASPALIFREIDEYGYLHVIPDSHVDGFAPGTVAEYRLTRIVDISERDRTVEIRDIIFTADPAEMFRSMLGRNTENSVYEEDGHFIIDGPFAESFIASHFQSLLASFRLCNPEVLSRYRIRYARPKVHFRFHSGIDFLEGEGDVEIAGETIGLGSFLSSCRQNNGYVLLSDRSRAYIDKAFMKKLGRLVRMKDGKAIISFFDIPCIEELDDIEADGEALKKAEDFYKGINEIGRRQYSTSIKSSSLRGYQEDGCRWLRYLHDAGMGGCLADEMGLGKTVQVIALLNDISAARRDKPSLLIVPKSIIHNWLAEISRFGIGLRPFVYYGQARDADELKKLNGGIIISSYATIRNDIAKLADMDFDYIILDESQMIKHFSTRTAQAVLNLKAEHRIAISGTPVENDLGELYSLFRFLNPAFFPSPAGFERDYAKPIMNGDKDAERELRMKIYPFIMRRLKKDVLRDLPEKTEQTIYIDMADEHWNRYEEKRRQFKAMIETEVRASGMEKSAFIILQALAELRRIATLPEGSMETVTISAKREYLRNVLPEITAAGHKALVFTSFLDAVERIAEDLADMGIGYAAMTGATGDRDGIVSRFQSDPDTKVFLMTLKTGGVGLNLTAADYVFIFDPWWNSATEDQAVNRAHRIGQRNPVFCYRLIAKDTIEERMLELQMKKRTLSSAIITSDGIALKSLTEEDLENLLR